MGLVKSECVHARTYDGREQAAVGIFEYIEVVHDGRRIRSALGDLSPVEYEEANWPEDGGRPDAA